MQGIQSTKMGLIGWISASGNNQTTTYVTIRKSPDQFFDPFRREQLPQIAERRHARSVMFSVFAGLPLHRIVDVCLLRIRKISLRGMRLQDMFADANHPIDISREISLSPSAAAAVNTQARAIFAVSE